MKEKEQEQATIFDSRSDKKVAQNQKFQNLLIIIDVLRSKIQKEQEETDTSWETAKEPFNSQNCKRAIPSRAEFLSSQSGVEQKKV